MIRNPILASLVAVAVWAAAMEVLVWGPARRWRERRDGWRGWRGPG